MSGSLAFFTRPAAPWRYTLGLEGGNRGTWQPSAGLSHAKGKWGASSFFRAFDTDGYLIVPEERAGTVDRPAGVRFVAGAVKLDYGTSRERFSTKLDILAEERANGTVIQRNSTSLGTLSGNYAREVGNLQLGLIGYHTRQQYHQSFSFVAASRNFERLTTLQSVPSTAWGGGGFLQKRTSRVKWTVGADAQSVDGVSRETPFTNGLPTEQRLGGGTQNQGAIFGQGTFTVKDWQIFAGSRGHFAGSAGNFYAPNAGLAWAKGRWRARASAYRAFRAPTLNELYREFRAGNAITQANADLRTEKLWASEAGLDFRGETYTVRVGGYWNEISDLIANVTLVNTPAQIIRQRQNTAAATVRGLEAEFAKNFGPVRTEFSYLMADSRFSTRERLPQIPRHQGSAQATWSKGGTLLTFGIRASSLQFEDDRNTLPLPGYAWLVLSGRQKLWKGLIATFGMENAANRLILTGFTPFPQTGAPRLFRLGLRYEGGL
ncbi:MAG: TonB-dependent receptor [Bryobacter sp.]